MAKEYKFGLKFFGLGTAVKQTEKLNNNIKNIDKTMKNFKPKSAEFSKKLEDLFGMKSGRLSKPLGEFEKSFFKSKNAGSGFLKSTSSGIKGMIASLGGLKKILSGIAKIGVFGILAFLGKKAWQFNLGGIVTQFNRIKAALGGLMGKLNIAISKLFKDLGPLFKTVFKAVGDVLFFVIKGLSKLLDLFNKAPKAVRIMIVALLLLNKAFLLLSANPFILTIGGIVAAVWLLYKGIKAIVDLVKRNRNLNMSIGVNGNQLGSQSGKTTNNNTAFNNSNTYNIQIEDRGNGQENARAFISELQLAGILGGTR